MFSEFWLQTISFIKNENLEMSLSYSIQCTKEERRPHALQLCSFSFGHWQSNFSECFYFASLSLTVRLLTSKRKKNSFEYQWKWLLWSNMKYYFIFPFSSLSCIVFDPKEMQLLKRPLLLQNWHEFFPIFFILFLYILNMRNNDNKSISY